MSQQEEHREARHRHLECTCGYQATSQKDLEEHVEAMARI